MNFPDTVVAGDTLDFIVSVPDYPPSAGWTLKYRLTARFAAPTQAPITLTASASGSDYQVQAGPATTAAWLPGAYTWARWVEKSGARQTLSESGQLEVKADPALTTQGFDSRSHARTVLEAIEAVIEGRASKDQEEYTIGSRHLRHTPIAELLVLRDRYKAEVSNEEAAARIASGLSNPRNFGVRFNRV